MYHNFFFFTDCPDSEDVTVLNINITDPDKRGVVQEIMGKQTLDVIIPATIKLEVAIPKALPPVQCLIHTNITNMPPRKYQNGSTTSQTHCVFDHIFTEIGRYVITFQLSYVANISGSKTLLVNAATGKIN